MDVRSILAESLISYSDDTIGEKKNSTQEKGYTRFTVFP